MAELGRPIKRLKTADTIAFPSGLEATVETLNADGSLVLAFDRSGALVVGVSAGSVPGAAARIRDAIARRFDIRYARALDRLAGVRRTALDNGEVERWRAMARGVVDGAFCRAVEEGTLDEKVTSWR